MALGTATAQSIRPASCTAGAWQYSLFDSYGGGVLVPGYSAGGAYVIAGSGGHASPDHTGAVLFDFTTGQWVLLRDATGSEDRSAPYQVSETNGAPDYELATSGVTPNSVPAPPHPYMNLLAIAPGAVGGARGSVVYPIAWAQCSQSVGSTRSHRFDLATRTWSRFTSNRLADLSSSLAVGAESPSVYDPVEQRMWQLPVRIHDVNELGFIDLTMPSPTWQLSATWPCSMTWEATSAAWVDASRRLILLQSAVRLVALNLDDLQSGPHLLTVSGTLPTTLSRWELYPADGNFYTKGNSGNVIYRLQPPANAPLTGTWTVSALTITGATLPSISPGADASGARHYSRFFYVPSLEVFAWIASADEPVMLIRPP